MKRAILLSVKGRHNHPKRPPISPKPDPASSDTTQLGCHDTRVSAMGLDIVDGSCEAEIDDLHDSIVVDEDVLWFQVGVDESEGVDIGDSLHHSLVHLDNIGFAYI